MTAPADRHARVASIASGLFAVSMFLCVASVNVPYKASDSNVLSWWQDPANLTSTIASLFFTTSAAVLFIVVANHLRAVASNAEGEVTPLAAFGHSMAAAFCSVMLVVAAMRGVVGRLVKVDGDPLPGLGVLRFSTSLGYALLGTGAMGVLGLSILATSVVVLRSRCLARWVGIVGIVCAVLTLGASAAMLASIATPVVIVWAFSIAVAMWRRPAAARAFVAHEVVTA
ncbi:MAG: hypothetical protein WCB04_08535 [Mycobacteriales bacterium]